MAPRVHLAGGGSIRLSGLWSYGSRQAELVRIVEEILSLLGVQVPVEGQPLDQASDQDPSSSLPGVHVPAQEHLTGQLPDKAPGPDSSNGLAGRSPVGLPGESVGAPRPPRHFLKGLRSALPYVLGFTLGILYIVSSAVRVLVILLYCVLALLSLIRLMTGSRSKRSARSRPSSRQS